MFSRKLVKHPSLAKKSILGLEKKPCMTYDKQLCLWKICWRHRLLQLYSFTQIT